MTRTTLAFFPILALVGCAGPDEVVPEADVTAPATTLERLADPTTLTLAPESRLSVLATATWPERREAEADLEVAGTLTAHAWSDGTLALEALEVEIGDVVISADSLPPSGLHLTDVRLRLDQAAAASGAWTLDQQRGVAELSLALTLEWSLVTSDGDVHPLAPQRLAEVPAIVVIETDDEGLLAARLEASKPGVFFAWSGLIELADLQIEVRARETGSR